MKKIVINLDDEEEVELPYKFDNNQLIKDRLVVYLSEEEQEDYLPSFFLFEKIVYGTRAMTIQASNVVESLKELSMNEFLNSIERLAIIYKELSDKDLINLYISYNDVNDEDILTLRERYPKIVDPRSESEKYEKYVVTQIKKIKKDVERKLKKNDELNVIKGVNMGDYMLESVTIKYSISSEFDLINIFDELSISKRLPFCTYTSYAGDSENPILYTKFYKNYRKDFLELIKEWSEKTSKNRGVPFLRIKILNSPLHFNRVKDPNVLYTDIYWDRTEIRMKISSEFINKKDEIFSILKESLGKTGDSIEELRSVSIFPKILSEDQVNIRGKYNLKNFNIDRAIFGDMVYNNPLMREFLFFDESKQTVVTKNRLVFYFNITGFQVPEESFTITTARDVLDPNLLYIRVGRAENIHQIALFKSIFQKLLGYYKIQFKNVLKIYEKFIPSFVDKVERITGEALMKPTELHKKREKKTKYKLTKLFEAEPEIFLPGTLGYAKLCQKKTQPYIISSEESDKLKKICKGKKLKCKGQNDAEMIKTLTDNKLLLKYPKIVKGEREDQKIYACYEPNRTHIYPGLRVNKILPNSEEYPFVPCCFVKPQLHNRKYKQYFEGLEEITTSIIGFNVNRILETKIPPPGRWGVLPRDLIDFFKMLGYRESTKYVASKQKTLPILQQGTRYDGNSFLAALLVATSEINELPSDDDIISLRDDIIDYKYITVGMQNMFDFSVQEIKDYLSDASTYIDPDMFIELLSSYFNINIFLFVQNNEFPRGNIDIGRSNKVYLQKKYDNKKRSVIIIKNQIFGRDYPYYCTVVGNVKTQSYYFDGKEGEKLIKYALESNDVYMLNETGAVLYKPF